MPRLLLRLPLFVVAALVLTSSAAWAKPKASIFGLEVINLGAGAVGAQDTANAAALTEALRNASSPKFDITNDRRELQDEKLMGNCQNEAAGCMSALARGAEFLILGNIEKKTHEGKDAYWIRIRLLDAKSKAYEQERWQGYLPLTAVKSSGQLKEWAARVHDALAGAVAVKPPPQQPKTGKLVVTVRNTRLADVFVDGDKAGELSDGSLTLTLPPGSHDVVIEAKDYKRHTESVTIASGRSESLEVELDAVIAAPPPPKGSNKGIWRAATWTGAAVGLAGGGLVVYGWTKVRDAEKETRTCMCDEKSEEGIAIRKRGKDGQTLTYVGAGVIGVGAAVMIIAGYRGYLASDPPERATTSSRGKRKRREFAVTPVVSANGGGATLRFDW